MVKCKGYSQNYRLGQKPTIVISYLVHYHTGSNPVQVDSICFQRTTFQADREESVPATLDSKKTNVSCLEYVANLGSWDTTSRTTDCLDINSNYLTDGLESGP